VVAGQAKWKFRLILRKLLPFAFLIVSVPAFAATCNITASGPIQQDGTLGSYQPFEADVYQIQGTITADYVDDDEANNGVVTFTSPTGGHTVKVGMFLLNAGVNGANTYAVRVAAGYVSKGVWMPGTWTWSMSYSDRASNTCTATGSVTVQNAFAPSQGFLRQYSTTNNLITDGNGKLFVPTGQGWYNPYWSGSAFTYGYAGIPGIAYVTVSGTAVTWVSGTQFTTQSLPSGVYNQFSICSNQSNCTIYNNVTINSATSATLQSSGGTLANPTLAYLGFERDVSVGNHAVDYQATLPQAAQFYMSFGTNFSRLAGDQNAIVWNSWGTSTGYNTYNWSTTYGNNTQGIPGVDLWFAAAHAAGMHIMWGGPWYDTMNANPCPSFTCTTAEKLSLENFYAMVSARWGAFYDVLELMNEGTNVPQTWVDYVGNVLTNGVSGIAGGNPADPYGHFFTNSYFPSYPNAYTSTYGPGTSTPDAYLNFVDMQHQDGPVATPVYGWMNFLATSQYAGCPSVTYNPNGYVRLDGESATSIGVTNVSQTANAPNMEMNSPRINDAAQALNQCGVSYFGTYSEQNAFNSVTPTIYGNWYAYGQGRVNLHNFMTGVDPAAAPITVTLGGGCGSGACLYAALGSSNHVRIDLNSATGNGTTGIPNTVTNPSVTLKVPAANMTVNWINPATGANLASTTTTSGTKKLIYTGTFTYDLWLQLDYSAPPSQFSGLLTSSTDLTCFGVATPACSTWPVPAMPSAGGSYADPTWGTTTYRLANNSVYSGQLIPTYSRVQGFSSDNKHLFVSETPNNSYIDLYDATQTPPLPFPHTCLTREQ
jgi:hypothetical protein